MLVVVCNTASNTRSKLFLLTLFCLFVFSCLFLLCLRLLALALTFPLTLKHMSWYIWLERRACQLSKDISIVFVLQILIEILLEQCIMTLRNDFEENALTFDASLSLCLSKLNFLYFFLYKITHTVIEDVGHIAHP